MCPTDARCPRLLNQIFWPFPPRWRPLHAWPLFVRSSEEFARNAEDGWRYKLWTKGEIEELCRRKYPHLFPAFRRFKHEINRVDFAKYMVAHTFGGVVSDLDVLPLKRMASIVGEKGYLFDRCSRPGVIANDFFCVPRGGLPGLLEFCVERTSHVESKRIYDTWKMRRVFFSTGPDSFTAYLKKAGLAKHCRAISDRLFEDDRRNVLAPAAPSLMISHALSWVEEVQSDNHAESAAQARKPTGRVGGERVVAHSGRRGAPTSVKGDSGHSRKR